MAQGVHSYRPCSNTAWVSAMRHIEFRNRLYRQERLTNLPLLQ